MFAGRTISRKDVFTTAGYSQHYGQMKTLAVRIFEDLGGWLNIIARLNNRTVTEKIRLAIGAWIAKTMKG